MTLPISHDCGLSQQALRTQQGQIASRHGYGHGNRFAMPSNYDAKSNYQKVLDLAPQHGGALTGMGILAFRAKDYAAAENYLKSAISFASDYPRAHQYCALVLGRLGRQAESKRESDLAASLNEEQARTSRGNFLTVLQYNSSHKHHAARHASNETRNQSGFQATPRSHKGIYEMSSRRYAGLRGCLPATRSFAEPRREFRVWQAA